MCNTRQFRRPSRLVLFALPLSVLLGNAAVADSMLILKGGSYRLSDTTQTISGPPPISLSFTAASKSAFGIEYGWRFDSGWSAGVEIADYSHKWTSAITTSGSLNTATVMAIGKKSFLTSDWFQPFVGAGIGFAGGGFKGPGGTASLFGFGLQAMAGFELRYQNVGFYAEYKLLGASTEDSSSEKINVSGTGLYGGLGIHF